MIQAATTIFEDNFTVDNFLHPDNATHMCDIFQAQ